jgi:hypothetical protein
MRCQSRWGQRWLVEAAFSAERLEDSEDTGGRLCWSLSMEQLPFCLSSSFPFYSLT